MLGGTLVFYFYKNYFQRVYITLVGRMMLYRLIQAQIIFAIYRNYH
ncbi:hypothetical protein EC2730350_2704 [Escherichia coli 2730350]|nr:hypothetical protein EC2730350_2704 [Escherichia coli 2730350]